MVLVAINTKLCNDDMGPTRDCNAHQPNQTEEKRKAIPQNKP